MFEVKSLKISKLEPLPLHVQLAEQLRYHIEAGTWTPGARLPTVRELAGALRINYNTVRQALQELERQEYVRTEQGRGTFVAESPPHLPRTLQESLQDIVDEAIIKAQAIGIDADGFARTAYARAKCFSPPTKDIRVLIAECNRPDLHCYVDLIEKGTGLRPEPWLLTELGLQPDDFFLEFDLLATPMIHVVELQDIVGAEKSVLGLMVKPSYLDVLFEIVRLPEGSRIGLVCSSKLNAGQMERALRGVGATHLDFLKAGCDSVEDVERVFTEAEFVYVSRLGLSKQATPWPHQEKVRPYIDHIDESGFRLLRRQVAAVRARRANPEGEES